MQQQTRLEYILMRIELWLMSHTLCKIGKHRMVNIYMDDGPEWIFCLWCGKGIID